MREVIFYYFSKSSADTEFDHITVRVEGLLSEGKKILHENFQHSKNSQYFSHNRKQKIFFSKINFPRCRYKIKSLLKET